MAITDYEDKIREIVNDENHSKFIFDFLSVYDKISKSTITKLKNGNNNLSKINGEVHLKNKLYFKETNDDLLKVFSMLEEKISSVNSKPRYIIITDYNSFLAKDTKTNDTLDIKFNELPRYFDFFLAWNGIEKADFEKESPADIKAAERFAKIFDEILKDNENVSRHGMNLFLIRILFCLFAEDTGLFNRNLFTNYLKEFVNSDASNMDYMLNELFSFLDIKNREDKIIPSYLVKFPYVNGQLFTENHEKLLFTSKSRELIIDAGELVNWSKVNPDILGSMLQAVASDDHRNHLGMHYTSVTNILKVIKPLFLNDLKTTFNNSKGDYDKLNKLLTRIGNIKFMDPACGSGNFLIITYKELRKLEMEIYVELRKLNSQTFYFPSVSLEQLYGLEIEDFAVDVTRLSLWIIDHQMNLELKNKLDDVNRSTLPLQTVASIKRANSLLVKWNDFINLRNSDEVYLFGNPPYLGAKKQSSDQKHDLEVALDGNSSYKKLDYISGWFNKAAKIIYKNNVKVGFVTTNSVTQGEQVYLMWPNILRYCEIFFAYKSFKWSNNAKNNAGVDVTIIGLRNKDNDNKYIFYESGFKKVNNINPYLSDGENIIIQNRDSPISDLPNIYFGSMPRDGGNLILNDYEYNELKNDINDSSSDPILRKYVGANDFINGKSRYCLWMDEQKFLKFKENKIINERITSVRNFRMQSKAKSTKKAASTPWSFVQKGEYEKSFKRNSDKSIFSIVIPGVSSGNRLYVPMGIVDYRDIISNSAMAIYNAPLWLLGVLESRMHMVWLKNIGGKFKMDYRYSASLVYNTFPIPNISTRRKNEIEDLILNILDIREEEGGSLAELYGSPLASKNPKPMNTRLLEAHKNLDFIVDKLYKKNNFKDDNERLSFLLRAYNKKLIK